MGNTNDSFYHDLLDFGAELVNREGNCKVYGIPKNGMILVYMLKDSFPEYITVLTDEKEVTADTIIIDDIIDTGKTFSCFPANKKVALYGKPYSPAIDFVYKVVEGWIDIPFEKEKPVEDHIVRLLQYIGEDPTREGLADTPRRVIKSFTKLYEGYGKKAEDVMTTFENESNKFGGIDQIIGLSNIEYYSTCEHHMIPFFGKAHIYYIPDQKICGISKLARILDIHARRLQNQERIAKDVADDIERLLKPKGVAVILEGQHLCMLARGVMKQSAVMKTSELRGFFRDNQETRQELFNLIR